MQTTSPYKTAADLGIEQWEHDGLVALIGPLSRGRIGYKFDMRASSRRVYRLLPYPACGTARCIGGHLAAARGMDADNYVARARQKKLLKRLFYPTRSSTQAPHPAWHCSDRQAARAIVNFLTLGEPRWDDVMREPDISFDTCDDSGAREHLVERETAPC